MEGIMPTKDESLLGQGKTGRYLVVMEETALDAGVRELENKAGIRVTEFRAMSGPTPSRGLTNPSEGNISFDQLGVAVLNAEPDQVPNLRGIAAASGSPIRLVEEERYVFAIGQLAGYAFDVPSGNGYPPAHVAPPGNDVGLSAPEPVQARRDVQALSEFVRGYRAAVNALADGLFTPERSAHSTLLTRELEAQVAGTTWGLTATRVPGSRFTGRGIKLAVLDTGIDLTHPDFAGRNLHTQSFVDGEAVQDLHGHGTHCCGSAAGPLKPSAGVPRYGVAYQAELYVGKVLDNTGRGTDASILAGINWAVQNQCAIVSMSLGGATRIGEAYSEVYETAARRAAVRGTLIIAAAGNESRRPQEIAPVAVAAVDQTDMVARFSCAGLNPAGGDINVTGPGVDVFSSWPLPVNYKTISGTSMATPHVAGITALYAESTALRGFALANAMLRASRRLETIRDFGWGLVQSP
jgi:subtilisin